VVDHPILGTKYRDRTTPFYQQDRAVELPLDDLEHLRLDTFVAPLLPALAAPASDHEIQARYTSLSGGRICFLSGGRGSNGVQKEK